MKKQRNSKTSLAKEGRNSINLLIIMASVVFLFGCIIYVITLRFERGDIYPPYSSLRSDPLGNAAYFESLGRLPGRSSRRNMRPFSICEPGHEDTFFIFGSAQMSRFNEESDSDIIPEEVLPFVNSGGRLVLSYAPAHKSRFNSTTNAWDIFTESANSNHVESSTSTNQMPACVTALPPRHDKWLGINPDMNSSSDIYPRMATATRHASEAGLPEQLPTYTDLCLTNSNESWIILYEVNNRPVVAERRLGKGTIVITTLSYVFSNEALRNDCYPRFLAWVAGPNPNAIFDEWHFGIEPRRGIAVLAREYGLTGGVVLFLLLAVLYVWKQSMPLSIPPDESPHSQAAAGYSAHSGFINLLMRSISPNMLLKTCLQHWSKSTRHTFPPDSAVEDEINDFAEKLAKTRKPNPKDLVDAYNGIVRRLNDKNKSTPKES